MQSKPQHRMIMYIICMYTYIYVTHVYVNYDVWIYTSNIPPTCVKFSLFIVLLQFVACVVTIFYVLWSYKLEVIFWEYCSMDVAFIFVRRMTLRGLWLYLRGRENRWKKDVGLFSSNSILLLTKAGILQYIVLEKRKITLMGLTGLDLQRKWRFYIRCFVG